MAEGRRRSAYLQGVNEKRPSDAVPTPLRRVASIAARSPPPRSASVSLTYTTRFLDSPVHVLELRGRTAFLAHEVGAAAGYAEDGDRFLQMLTTEWAPSL